MKLSSLLEAHYDVARDKIVGAEKGSLVWFHEAGHRFLFKRNPLSYVGIRATISSWTGIALFALCIESSEVALQYFGYAGFVLLLGEEFFAWGYALKHCKRKKAVKA